jgi:thiamine pyrophosphokinase
MTVVVFAGGRKPLARLVAAIPEGATVVAADRGVDHALAFGLSVDVAVGDFDSISPAGLAELERSGARVDRHPVAKEASDLELALDLALTFRPERVLVVGGAGGRLDHLLGQLLLLSAEAYAGVELDAQLGRAAVHVVRGERLFAGRVGESVSLFALHGVATGVVTEGLVYPLRGEALAPGSSRGLSNVFATREARVSVRSGVVLAVRPSGSF